MSSLGYGQTWQAVTRVSGTTYYNTTGKPIQTTISAPNTGTFGLTINGILTFASFATASMYCVIIPTGNSYSYTGNYITFLELR